MSEGKQQESDQGPATQVRGKGCLVLVPTPIGNLADLSPRSREALASADVIACEDTRVTRRLLSALGIRCPPLVSYHNHNERTQASRLIRRITDEGLRVVLVCDAGTPGVSDPGAVLVDAAYEHGVDLDPMPGPSAAAVLISGCGFRLRRFVVVGFLPARPGDREREMRSWLAYPPESGFVAFESPSRIAASLQQLSQVVAAAGRRARVCIGRELSKVYQNLSRYDLPLVGELPLSGLVPRGEFGLVVALEGSELPLEIGDDEVLAQWAALRQAQPNLRLRDGARQIAARCGVPIKRVYNAVVASEKR